MNGIYPYSSETKYTKTYYNELHQLPKWAIDEQLYNCDPPFEIKKQNNSYKIGLMRAILLLRAIVNFS